MGTIKKRGVFLCLLLIVLLFSVRVRPVPQGPTYPIEPRRYWHAFVEYHRDGIHRSFVLDGLVLDYFNDYIAEESSDPIPENWVFRFTSATTMRFPDKENPTYGEVILPGSETFTVTVYENYFLVEDTLYKVNANLADMLENKYFD